MTRTLSSTATVALSLFAPLLLGAAGITVPDLTVGRNLQVAANIMLQPGPVDGLELTLTSDEPARLLLSSVATGAGSPSITLTTKPHAIASPEFYVHGLADSGTVTYTINAKGMGTAKGTVKLGPSGLAILGPFRLPSFPTTPRGIPSKLTIVATLLDSTHKVVEEQQVAGGMTVEVAIKTSNPEAGAPAEPKLKLTGGESVASTYFKPSAEGSTTLSTNQPAGFSAPSNLASVVAEVARPGIAITDELTIGKDLQMLGILCLGEAPGEGGAKVTLTSSDGSKMLLSTNEHEVGTASITVTVPPGEQTAKYYLQAIGDSGFVTYNATAQGFRHRVAKIGLSPSGIIVAYERYGPPDEAAVLRAGAAGRAAAGEERRFYASVKDAKEHPMHVVVFSAHLDPVSGLAADITVQPLRAGVTTTVVLTSSNPAVGTIESPLTIKSGDNRALSSFVPLSVGETIISVQTPSGFSTPKNATAVPATVAP